MKDNKNEMQQDSDNLYFLGQNLGHLMFEITQLVFAVYPPGSEIKIVPVEPEPFNLWWEFHVDDYCVCKIRFEVKDKYHPDDNLCWLEWYDERDDDFLEHYVSTFGYPDWVKTEEDEELFRSGVWNKNM